MDLANWDRSLKAEIDNKGLEVFTTDYQKGDVEVHDGRTMHMAGMNHSTRSRKALVLHLMQASTRLCSPATPEQHGHVELFGWDQFGPGDVICGPLAPRL